MVHWSFTRPLAVQSLLCPRHKGVLNIGLRWTVSPTLPGTIPFVEQAPPRDVRRACHYAAGNALQETSGCHLKHIPENVRNWQTHGGETNIKCPVHEWLLLQGDRQRVPLISITGQMEQQERVIPPHTATLWRVTEAPPIMVAPNPTTKRVLKLTKRTHSWLTCNNTPSSGPVITQSLSTRHPLPIPIPTQPVTALLRWLPRTAPPLTLQRIPRVCFQAIPGGGVHNSTMISQEAINFLTKCIWAKSPNI